MRQPLRDRLYTTRAIVLQSRDLGEADRIFVVFSTERGKISVIAKGARRVKSRLGPALDYFSEVDLNLTRARDLDVVTGAMSVNQHPRLRDDIDAYGHAAHCAELVRDLTQEQQENTRLYDLFSSSLSLLNDGVDPWHVTRHFELGLLVALGYRPEILRCVQCSADLAAEPNAFSSAYGGMLCPDCRGIDRAALMLSVNAQKYLRTMARAGLSSTVTLSLTERERHEVAQAMMTYLRYVGERDFASLHVLGAMQGTSGQAEITETPPVPGPSI